MATIRPTLSGRWPHRRRSIRTARFPSNWELATARAVEVTQVLIADGMRPQVLAAAGYGEFDPVVANDSPEHRAQNRPMESCFSLILPICRPSKTQSHIAKGRPVLEPPCARYVVATSGGGARLHGADSVSGASIGPAEIPARILIASIRTCCGALCLRASGDPAGSRGPTCARARRVRRTQRTLAMDGSASSCASARSAK